VVVGSSLDPGSLRHPCLRFPGLGALRLLPTGASCLARHQGHPCPCRARSAGTCHAGSPS